MAQRADAGPGAETVVLGGRQTAHRVVVQLRRVPAPAGAVQSHMVTAPVQRVHVRGLAVLVRLEPKGHHPGEQVQRVEHHHGDHAAHGTTAGRTNSPCPSPFTARRAGGRQEARTLKRYARLF